MIKEIDAEQNVVEYSYDDNNNLIEMRETDVSQVPGVAAEVLVTTFFYDSLNRLQQRTDNLGHTSYYRYDSRDRTSRCEPSGGQPGATHRRP